MSRAIDTSCRSLKPLPTSIIVALNSLHARRALRIADDVRPLAGAALLSIDTSVGGPARRNTARLSFTVLAARAFVTRTHAA